MQLLHMGPLNSHIVATGEDKEAILEEVEGQLAEILGADDRRARAMPSSIITGRRSNEESERERTVCCVEFCALLL